jgi:hypothetical protein
MIIFDILYRIARRAGHQGVRCSAGNQADSEKLTTGRNKPSPFLYNQLRLITLVLPYHHFESTFFILVSLSL